MLNDLGDRVTRLFKCSALWNRREQASPQSVLFIQLICASSATNDDLCIHDHTGPMSARRGLSIPSTMFRIDGKHPRGFKGFKRFQVSLRFSVRSLDQFSKVDIF